ARCEAIDQGLRSWIVQHPPHLLLEYGGILQPARLVQEFVVRNGAPEEERQARREFEAAEPVRRSGGEIRGGVLDAEQKAGGGKNAFEPHLDAGVEVL